MQHIVIIGNGISGITAARHIRKRSHARITVISSETEHFFSRTALMYIYMGHMQFEHTKPYEDFFWQKNNIELLFDHVDSIDFDQHTLTCRSGSTLQYDKLILAVGSVPNKFGWDGQDLDGVQGLYSYQDLELLEKNTHAPFTPQKRRMVTRAVIVGGGLIGVELAEMLHTRDIDVTFLVREDRFWGNVLPKEEGELVSRHLREHHVDLRFNTELDAILADAQGRARAVRTKDGEEIECQLVGLTAGVRPNIDFLKDLPIETDRGILVNEYLETSQPDVFAIGDCAQFRTPPKGRRPIEQVWYTGRMMGDVVALTITGIRTPYEPGHWFNSAKFFDIEYQTYGRVNADPGEHEETFYWEHPDGKIGLKLVFEPELGALIGVNSFGMRLRHEVLNKWLDDEARITDVIEHLSDANFDAEFYKRHERSIADAFNSQFGTTLKPRRKSWKRILNAKPFAK
jgi:NADPH-dependent 2,4-dienoyl-CoA reductase/sulfur reductase-like enzyme